MDSAERLPRSFREKILELLYFQIPNLCSLRGCFFSMLPLFVGGLKAEYFINNNSSVVKKNIRVCVDVLSLFLIVPVCVFYIL